MARMKRRRKKLKKYLLVMVLFTLICGAGILYWRLKPCEHDYQETILNTATCTETGLAQYTCSKCDDTYTEEIPLIQGEWLMTQYPDASGDQGTFYTFYNKVDGYLMVIDGGKEANTTQVRGVIRAYGGHVNTWIITHYHDDHVSPFNAIYEDLEGITIDQVIASPMDYDYYSSIAESWDRLDCFTKFLDLTGDTDLVTYVSEGDTYNVDGLKLHFLNSYSEDTKQYGYIPNNGALAFTIYGNKDSAFFCSDCQSDQLAQHWIEAYGSEIQTEYLQVGHHGNSDITYDSYDYMNPQVVFFDAPAWEMEDGTKYKAKGLKEHLESNGVTCVDFTTGAHSYLFE